MSGSHDNTNQYLRSHTSPRDLYTWNTDDEIWFLERLGLHRIRLVDWKYASEKLHWAARRDLLVTYRTNMHLRVNWGWINPQVVEEYLDYELERLDSTKEPFELSIEELLSAPMYWRKRANGSSRQED